MAEAETERGIVTKLVQGLRQSDNKPYAFFYINGKNTKDVDPSYSLDIRQPGAPVPVEGDSIFFSFRVNGAYNNVIMFERVEPVEGEVKAVAATVTATQDKREEGIFRSVALAQAVVFCGPICIRDGQTTPEALIDFDVVYLHFLKSLTNPASLREPGDVDANAAGRTPKAVLDHNGPRDSEGYLVKASDAERASQDAAAPGTVTDPADPKYVERYAPA